MEQGLNRLPTINEVGVGAPFRWLSQGFSDFQKALAPALLYGVVVAGASAWISYTLVASNLAFWVLSLSCGFVFIAPMLAMGLYEAGRLIEAGETPTLQRVLFVRRAVRSDVAYLGLALLLIYFLWGRFAQLVYGLSTYTLHTSVDDFINFALTTSEGHTMLITGTIVGGVFACATFALVVVSAPMLLDRRANVFVATITSVGAVAKNFAPLLLWALIITALLLAAAATWFTALVVVFPWLGLASWRAYRALVEMPA